MKNCIKFLLVSYMSLSACLNFCAAPAIIRIEEKVATEPEASGLGAGDYFDAIKHRIKLSENFCRQDMCAVNALRLRKAFFTAQSLCVEDSFHGTLKEFMEKSGTKFRNVTAEKFFSLSTCVEHVIFEVHIPGHTFLVEKKSNNEDIWWRIYQSWKGLFNIGQWLGIGEWFDKEKMSSRYRRLNIDLIDKFYHEYGQGKKLSYEQIIDFIKESIHMLIGNSADSDIIIVKSFQVDPKIYESIPMKANLPIFPEEYRVALYDADYPQNIEETITPSKTKRKHTKKEKFSIARNKRLRKRKTV